MKSAVFINAGSVPDGVYNGHWTGVQVRFTVGQIEITASTSIGVRGLNVPCLVVVLDGNATVESVASGSVKVQKVIERDCCDTEDLRSVKCTTLIPAAHCPKFCIHCGQWWVLKSFTDAAGDTDTEYVKKVI